VNDHQLADDLTLAGIGGRIGEWRGRAIVFDMEITTNRPDAMTIMVSLASALLFMICR